MTPDLLAQLRLRSSDAQAEVQGKLRLFGRYACLCDNDCPAGA